MMTIDQQDVTEDLPERLLVQLLEQYGRYARMLRCRNVLDDGAQLQHSGIWYEIVVFGVRVCRGASTERTIAAETFELRC